MMRRTLWESARQTLPEALEETAAQLAEYGPSYPHSTPMVTT